MFFLSFFLHFSRTPKISATEIIGLTNQTRIDQGLNPLQINEKLMIAADEKLSDMERNRYFSHESPEGVSPWYWIEKNNYSYIHAGENLAINFNNSEKLLSAWLSSPEHKANLLSKKYSEIGVSIKIVGDDADKKILIVQMFGFPKTLAVK